MIEERVGAICLLGVSGIPPYNAVKSKSPLDFDCVERGFYIEPPIIRYHRKGSISLSRIEVLQSDRMQP